MEISLLAVGLPDVEPHINWYKISLPALHFQPVMAQAPNSLSRTAQQAIESDTAGEGQRRGGLKQSSSVLQRLQSCLMKGNVTENSFDRNERSCMRNERNSKCNLKVQEFKSNSSWDRRTVIR